MFADDPTGLSNHVLDRLKAGDSALAPAFWSVEVLNSLLVGEKRRLTLDQSQREAARVLGVKCL